MNEWMDECVFLFFCHVYFLHLNSIAIFKSCFFSSDLCVLAFYIAYMLMVFHTYTLWNHTKMPMPIIPNQNVRNSNTIRAIAYISRVYRFKIGAKKGNEISPASQELESFTCVYLDIFIRLVRRRCTFKFNENLRSIISNGPFSKPSKFVQRKKTSANLLGRKKQQNNANFMMFFLLWNVQTET